MSKKITYDFIKSEFEKENYSLLSKEYINSSSKLEYECPNGHRHVISWNKWQYGRRCPYCVGRGKPSIDFIRQEFLKEGYILLSDVYTNCATKLNYICPNGHRYSTSWDAWCSKNSRCAICSNNAKLDTEYVSKSLENEGYKILSRYKNANTDFTYVCSKGHTNAMKWSHWYRGERCPDCSGKKRHSLEFIKYEFEKEAYKILSESYKNGKQKLEFVCPNGHQHSINWNNWSNGQRCYKCNVVGTSDGEQRIIGFINSIYSGIIIERDKSLISPYELDIVIPDKKLAIEYCGLYWHSELMGKDSKYHLNKLKMCNEVGYRLITIFEDEWILNKNIVMSRLKNLFRTYNKTIYARKCLIKEISTSEAKIFCEQNHLQGYTGSSTKLGLFFNNELVSVMTFGKPSISKGTKTIEDGVWELSRFCSLYDYRIIGGASKLFSYFCNNYNWKKIISYADRRWSDGNLYNKLGFDFLKTTKPNYWYIKDQKRLHRFNFRKTSYDRSDHTEWEIRQSQGLNRIWDCGNLKYIKIYNNHSEMND